MALFVNARAGLWLDGVTVAGQDLRLQATSAMLTGLLPSGSTGIAARPGVRYGFQSPLSVQPSSGMNIIVQAGMAFVQGSTAANSGMYTAELDTNSTITVATSDPTNPRIDNVIVQVNDVGTSSSTVVITLQTGTPAPSPVAPSLPANSLLLATVAVAANTTTITGGNITDQRQFTVANGGILPVKSLGGSLPGTLGYYAHELSSGRLWVSDGLGNARQPKVAAFGATTSGPAGSPTTAAVGSYTTIATVSVTTDGSTELEIYAAWASLTPPGTVAVGDYINIAILQDGAGFSSSANIYMRVDSTSVNPTLGGSIRGWSTPAAGSHTYTLVGQSIGHAFAVNGALLRVAPSLQQ